MKSERRATSNCKLGFKCSYIANALGSRANCLRYHSGTYKVYIQSTGYLVWLVTLLLLAAAQVATLGERYWIKLWGEAYNYSLQMHVAPDSWHFNHMAMEFRHHDGAHRLQSQHLFSSAGAATVNATIAQAALRFNLPSAHSNPGFYLSGLLFINIASFCVSLLSTINGYYGSYNAAIKIHNAMLDSVLGATVRFFDQTPSGRLINRFSRDVETIDGSLSSTLRMVLANVAILVGAISFTIVLLPGFILPAVFITYGFYALTVRYLNTSRSLRRIEATQRSPIFSGFSEALDGITVIRAFGVERQFIAKLFKEVDAAQASFYQLWMSNRWLLYRFDAIGAAAVFATTCLALGGAISPGSAGVAILSTQSLISAVYWVSRNWGQLEQDMNSLERASDYLQLEQEPARIIDGKRPPAAWPSQTKGQPFLRVENFSLAYSPELPNVLHDLNIEIRPQEKIAVVGRTGSGKSTFAM